MQKILVVVVQLAEMGLREKSEPTALWRDGGNLITCSKQ